MWMYCGGSNAETMHLFEGYTYTFTGNRPPVVVTVQWSGTYKYTTGKDFRAPVDSHESGSYGSKADGTLTGAHAFEQSREYVLDPPAGLAYAAFTFSLSWTNPDGTAGSARNPGMFQVQCRYP
jgi:hypothetical protein